jgi:uncharacterized membrane protein
MAMQSGAGDKSNSAPWDAHPAVRTGSALTFGERAADAMKRALATWICLLGFLALMVVWMATNGFGVDHAPYIGLNLVLSAIAGLQCFVLLIAAKRADQISSELAQYDHEVGLQDLEVDQRDHLLLLKIAAKLGIEIEEES